MPKGYSQYNQGSWHHTDEAKEKCRQAILGRIANGWHISEETRRKISLAHVGKHYHNAEDREKRRQRMLGANNPMFGKPNSSETKARISQALKGMFAGNKNPMAGRYGATHPNWRGGTAYLPYSADFNNRLKEKIRARDNYTCQECGIVQAKCPYPLAPHHIDYNKENSSEDNLISLCEICHGKTNYNREYWQHHFEEKIAKIFTPVGR